MRTSGVILPIYSLPSRYGIGTFGDEAYKFVDFLHDSGQTYWQILPLTPTTYGDSPYQSPSTFAGNPYFIDFDLLRREGLLNIVDYENIDWGSDPEKVDYRNIFDNRFKVLKKAFDNGFEKDQIGIDIFREENSFWIEDYALYMSLKEYFDYISYKYWDNDIRLREESSLNYYKSKLKNDIDFWVYVQYLFFKQWTQLKQYANQKGIRIIGDVPIYVSEDSVDVWANPEIFYLDDNNNPIDVAGCPPDAFTDDGQLWGNPLYRWDVLKLQKYSWWIERVKSAFKLYDRVRIDHFRGFESYYAIKSDAYNAKDGDWRDGPGIEFFNILEQELGQLDIIAEDLGYLTDDVRDMLKKTKYPGMTVLEFAFDESKSSTYLPHNHNKNSVIYIGTHDNDTLAGWLSSEPDNNIEFMAEYLNIPKYKDYHWGIIKECFKSVCDTSIFQMQDLLELGSEARTNYPSTIGDNWCWRMKPNKLTQKLADKIYNLTELYSRIPKQ